MAGVAGFVDRLRALRGRVDEVAKLDELAGEVDRRARRYCGEHGIPLSVFLGRKLTERTTVTHRRDDDGNLVVTRTTERDPEWLPGDIESALQFQVEQDALCSGCGMRRKESFDKATRYRIESHTCEGCAELQRASWLANRNRSRDSTPRFGVYHSLKKV